MNRKRQARWDGQHMAVLSTKLRTEDAAEISRLCKQQGRTVYAVLKDLLRSWQNERRTAEKTEQAFDCYQD